MTAIDKRKKNANWIVTHNSHVSVEQATLATLMDIRDELQSLNRLANCYRIPRALDAMHELGVAARRAKRTAAAKRKAARK